MEQQGLEAQHRFLKDGSSGNGSQPRQNWVSGGCDRKLSLSQMIVRDLTDESNSTTADAFSNALVETALKAAPHATSGGESSSSVEDTMVMAHKVHHSSSINSNQNSRTSGSSDDTRTGESGHLVTATGASTQTGTTTSSGDDGDSGGHDFGASGKCSASLEVTRGNHRHRYHHHHLPRSQTTQNTIIDSTNQQRREVDGCSLQLPSDDSISQLHTGPATVVASIMPPPMADANSSSGSAGEGEGDGLLQRHREPGYHTIRKTFSRLPKRIVSSTRPAESSSSEEQMTKKHIRGKHGYPNLIDDPAKSQKKKKGRSNSRGRTNGSISRRSSPPYFSDSNEGNGEGSSSGSGTEGGYMGSADSKENESSSSPSVSSTEDVGRMKSKRRRSFKNKDRTASMKVQDEQADDSGDSSSSEIADFSSGTTSENGEEGEPVRYALDSFHSTGTSLSSSNEDEGASSEDGYEATYMQAKNQILQGQQNLIDATARKRRALMESSREAKVSHWSNCRQVTENFSTSGFSHGHSLTPIMTIGSDIMAHVLTFLPPPVILDVLTMPLSKEWRQTFTFQPELWRVLCLVEPFKAEVDDNESRDVDDSCSEDSFGSLGRETQPSASPLLDKYRLLYTSFVRCMKYLAQIREDALNGNAPSYIDYGVAESQGPLNLVSHNRNLHHFLTKARKVQDDLSAASSSSEEPQQVVAGVASVPIEEQNKKRKRKHDRAKKEKKPKIGNSMITNRLLGPSATGDPGNLHLPWSCAIYSIVNWMVSFSDVEGIQTLCMKVLPFLLENEQQRQTAQRAGLTDIVLRAMVRFPHSVQLHIAAFHTVVLLARPLGGREGMLFHSSMILTGIFCQNSAPPKSGIAVMVDSMERFVDNDILQAMSCWALVNIALAPAQKAELVKLGGINATLNAMHRHPFSAEVQFRALFALINMIIPSVHLNRDNPEGAPNDDQISGVSDVSEKEIIDESVSEITGLVVRAMKNFCSSEAILNRACLVLHNLSLTQEYHSTLLWTPSCYQMLEWCLGNYRTDQVLQQSASGTLHRLQGTLSRDDDLRSKFTHELRSQQQATLYEAHREALRLHQRQEELNRAPVDAEDPSLP